MSDKESDQLRGIAHEIIIKLMAAGRLGALDLLDMHIKAAKGELTNETNPTETRQR